VVCPAPRGLDSCAEAFESCRPCRLYRVCVHRWCIDCLLRLEGWIWAAPEGKNRPQRRMERIKRLAELHTGGQTGTEKWTQVCLDRAIA
jgi:hypothetical protein